MTRTLFGTCLCSLLMAAPLGSLAHASPTRSFVLDSAAVLGEGKLDGTRIESEGSIRSGLRTRRTELAGVQSAKSLLLLPDGSAYVGTGNDGKIYAYRAGVARVLADTKQLMVSSLARDAKGNLYAGTLPSGKIFVLPPGGELRELCSPAGAEHVWALSYDERRKTLFAATGPEGKLFAIDPKGKADVFYDSEDAHLMALAPADDGSLYVGTSDRALLVRVRSAGHAEVIYDFDGSEVTAIALRGSQLAAVVNAFSKPITPAKPVTPDPAHPTPAPGPAPANADRPQAGKGVLYRVQPSGQVERLWTADEGHLTSVRWLEDDVIYAGTGKEGHIHRVRASDHSHALIADVDERQILALDNLAGRTVFVTGDAAAIYELEQPGQGQREWTSKVLDAGGRARFGRLDVRGTGPVRLSTRSGNTEKPDASWSDWSLPLAAQGTMQSPSARFLQLQVRLEDPASTVYALEAYYLPDNQAAVVTEVSIEPPKPRGDKPGPRAAPSGSTYKLRWKVDNPDGDSLRYRLYVAQEGEARYIPLLRESTLQTESEYSWDTEAAPDGYYRVLVEASDELDNPEPLARKTRQVSEPFLVDNRPPEIPELRADKSGVSGSARDALGPISKLEYNVDGLEWHLARAVDDLLDAREERFIIPMSQLPKGPHLVAVRASDARHNTTTRNIHVDVP